MSLYEMVAVPPLFNICPPEPPVATLLQNMQFVTVAVEDR